MATFKQDYWDERYAASELVWGADPNRFVREAFESIEPPGPVRRVLDLACGEGRNAIWLAERGWSVTAVDFSRVALERGRRLAEHRGVSVDFVQGDVCAYAPEARAFAWVVVSYLQLPRLQMRDVWPKAAAAVAPGGGLFGIGHAAANLARGHGGPSDPDVLWHADEIRSWLESSGLRVVDARDVERPIEGAPRPAIDTRVVARRPEGE